MHSVAERLGVSPEAKLLILTGADLGLCHASTAGVYRALRDGVATSASLMVPAPWARESASLYRGEDVGVQLTVNAEFDRYRWGPITQAPSLLDGDGGFPRTLEDVWDHADLDEVRRECRAQIERAVLWGFDISHLATHLDTLLMRPEFFDITLDLAIEFHLPMRLLGADNESNVGFPFRRLAAEQSILFADRFLTLAPHGTGDPVAALVDLITTLSSGLTEVTCRPAEDTPELRAAAPDWEDRCGDLEALLATDAVSSALASAGVTLVSYRALRDAMRQA